MQPAMSIFAAAMLSACAPLQQALSEINADSKNDALLVFGAGKETTLAGARLQPTMSAFPAAFAHQGLSLGMQPITPAWRLAAPPRR